MERIALILIILLTGCETAKPDKYSMSLRQDTQEGNVKHIDYKLEWEL